MTDLILALLVIDILHSLHCALIAFTIVFAISGIVHGWLYIMELYDEYKGDAYLNAMIRRFKYSMFGLMVVSFLSVLIPTKQTMQIALALYATGEVATMVTESDLGKQTLRTLELKLSQIEKELTEDKDHDE